MIKPQGGLVGLVEVLHSLHVVDFLNQPLVLGQRLVQHWRELVRYLAYWQVEVLPVEEHFQTVEVVVAVMAVESEVLELRGKVMMEHRVFMHGIREVEAEPVEWVL